jgi:hypothetical protein
MSNSSNRKLCQCKKCCQKSSAGKLVAYSTFRRHAVLELTQSQSSVFVEYLASVSATASASGTSVNLQLGVPANTGSSSDTSGGNLDQDMDDVEAEDNEDDFGGHQTNFDSINPRGAENLGFGPNAPASSPLRDSVCIPNSYLYLVKT